MRKLHYILSLLVIMSVSFFGGCEDNAPNRQNDPEQLEMRDSDVPLGGTMMEMMDEVDEGVMMPPLKDSKELRIEGAMLRSVFLNESVDLEVRYIGLAIGGEETALTNQNVTMRMLDDMGTDRTNGGIQGSRLQSARVNTNNEGIATFRLFAGENETSFRLEADAADADPVYFSVTVVRPGTGGLSVRVLYNVGTGRYNYQQLESAQVSLFINRTCDQIISDATRLSGAHFAWNPPINPFDDQNNTVTADDFEHGAEFTVATSISGASGQAIAFGCLEDVMIEGGRTVEIDVDAVDLPLEFKGKFITTNRFDLTDLLRSSESESLNRVADALDILRLLGSDDPMRGAELVRLICDIANVDPQACAIVSALANPIVLGLLDQVPGEVLDVLAVISDVLTIVSEMTIVGEIEFPDSYPDENNMLTGDNRWQKFRFTWRDNCPDLNCDREFTIGNLDQLARPIAGIFDAEINEDTIHIGQHGLNFRYGLIALGLAETWVIPSILGRMGPVSLRDLLSELMVDVCISIDNFAGQQGFCERVIVNALSSVIIDQLGRLDFDPEQFRIQGYATLVDENLDLRIDQLLDGVWFATIDTGDVVLQLNGCFTGCRDMECAEPLNQCDIPMDLLPIGEMDGAMGMNP